MSLLNSVHIKGAGVVSLHLLGLFTMICVITGQSYAQAVLSWQDIRGRFEANNRIMQAARVSVDQSRALEITAGLRPNPNFTASIDQARPWKPWSGGAAYTDATPVASVSCLFEMMNKRGLRIESAQKGTEIALSQVSDQERLLVFPLRNAFIQVLQQKTVAAVAVENLAYYDSVLQVSRERYDRGDIASIDLNRLELQRVQFESDLENARTNLRIAKIQLLTILNERVPVEQFDITGEFDFSGAVEPLENYRRIALMTRPDLKAAALQIDQAKINYDLAEANSSWDPTLSLDVGRNSLGSGSTGDYYTGVSVSIPLRIFDRNQGEKLRTKLDITRTEKMRSAVEAQLFSDVDSAYTSLMNAVNLLKQYKVKYLKQAEEVRETMTFSYERGGASLIDFLQAQQDYRNVRLGYLNLTGSCMYDAAQLNLAVGREVLE